MKGLKKINWKLLKFVFGLAVLIFLLSFSAIRHACHTVAGLEIEIDHPDGNYFVNDSLVRLIVDGPQQVVTSAALGNLDLSEIEQRLDNNHFIKKSHVYKDVNGALKIQVMQQKAVARVHTETEEYYLSEDLKKIPLSAVYSPRVILVGGEIEDAEFSNIRDFEAYVSADKLLKKHIIAIRKEGPNSFNLLVNKGNYVIEFGELADFDEKFRKLKLFYEQYLGKVGFDFYEKISLKFNNQIVATKRNNDGQ